MNWKRPQGKFNMKHSSSQYPIKTAFQGTFYSEFLRLSTINPDFFRSPVITYLRLEKLHGNNLNIDNFFRLFHDYLKVIPFPDYLVKISNSFILFIGFAVLVGTLYLLFLQNVKISHTIFTASLYSTFDLPVLLTFA